MKKNLQHLVVKELVSLGFRKADARLAYKGLLNALVTNLLAGDQVSIRGFGTFYLGERKAQVVDTPFTKGPVEVPAKRSLRFKPSPVFKDVINGVREFLGC